MRQFDRFIVTLLAVWLLLPIFGFALVGVEAVAAWFVGSIVGLLVPVS